MRNCLASRCAKENVLCEFLSLRDIAKRCLLRTAKDAVDVFSLVPLLGSKTISVSVRFFVDHRSQCEHVVQHITLTHIASHFDDTCIADVF